MKENADKARALDSAAIHKQLKDSSEQMFRLRFQMSMGQTEGLKKLRLLRKERARMLTVLRERELHPESGEPTPVKKSRPAKKSKAAAKAKVEPAHAKAAHAQPAHAKPAHAKPAHAKPAKAAAKKAASPKAPKGGAAKKAAAKKAPAKKVNKSSKG